MSTSFRQNLNWMAGLLLPSDHTAADEPPGGLSGFLRTCQGRLQNGEDNVDKDQRPPNNSTEPNATSTAASNVKSSPIPQTPEYLKAAEQHADPEEGSPRKAEALVLESIGTNIDPLIFIDRATRHTDNHDLVEATSRYSASYHPDEDHSSDSDSPISLGGQDDAPNPEMPDEGENVPFLHETCDENRNTQSQLSPSLQLSSQWISPPSAIANVSANGIWATMTPDEREEEDLAAVEQAEIGSIVVDTDDIETDAGYESDTATNASTSLSSSVRDFAFENGRRYHKFREGRYNFPNDEVEQEREDMKHAMVKMLCGQQLHFAPIGSNPQQILDIGTGTGIWAIEMGDLFESASVLGVDLSPIQPEWVPPNVRFMVDDVESPWLHPRNHFDYIHSRHTVMAIKDWPRLLRTAQEHLRPGGWIELQEIHHVPIAADGRSLPADHPVPQYWSLINAGLSALGVDFHAAAGGRLADMLRGAGYACVTERVLHVPVGTWPKNRVLKAVGLYWRTILLDGAQAIALGPLTRGCGWTPEQVEVFLVQVRKAYHDNSCLMYMPLHVVYAQKPL